MALRDAGWYTRNRGVRDDAQIYITLSLSFGASRSGLTAAYMKSQPRPSASTSARNHKRRKETRLGFEALERRDLLTAQPLTSLNEIGPEGSLALQATASAVLDTVGEVEEFTIDLNSGQTLAVLVEGATIQADVTITDPGGGVIASAASAAQGAVAQTAATPINVEGTYTISVFSAASSLGAFDLVVNLNASTEDEASTGVANDTQASAENLDARFITLAGGVAQRAVVVGNLDPTGPIDVLLEDSFETTVIDSTRWATTALVQVSTEGINEPSAPFSVNLNGGGSRLESRPIDTSLASGMMLEYSFQQTGGGESPDQGDDLFVEYRNSAGTWVLLDRQFGSGPNMTTFQLETVAIPDAFLHGSFQFRFRSVGSGSSFDDWYVDDIRLTAAGGGVTDAEDWFAFTLDDGQTASLIADASNSPAPTIELYDAVGILLQADDPVASVSAEINGFRDTTSDGLPDTYYVRVSQDTGDYSLLVTKGAGFYGSGLESSNPFVSGI